MAIRDWFNWALPDRASTTDLMSIGQPRTVQGVSSEEFGAAGTENFGGYIRREDPNPELDDWQKAVPIYEKMRRSDAQIRSMLHVIKLPLRGATWTCHPSSTDPVDKMIADFCNTALFEDDAMSESWDHVLRHILLHLDFGFSVLEKVWKVDEDGHYRYKRLAPRLPKTIRQWHTNREGKLVAVVQYAPVPHSTMRGPNGLQRTPTYNTSISYQYLTIPAEYAAVFTLDREGDNYQGHSILRNVYRNWYFKDQAYHTLGVGLDRWGVGIPVAELEEGHGLSTGETDQLREVLQAIRSNERAYLVAPPHVKFKLLPEGGGGSGTISSFGIQWIEHNDSQIARNVLAGFLTIGDSQRGTLGFGSRLTDMFISSLNGIASGIAADLKQQLVKPLCDLNFDMSRRKYPQPVCLDLEQTDLSSLLDVMKGLSGTVITPQDEDEDILRKMLGLPKLDPKNKRIKEDTKEKAALDAATPTPAPPPGQPGAGHVGIPEGAVNAHPAPAGPTGEQA